MSIVRRAVILVAQILALLFIVVATMAGALAGDAWAANAAPMFGGIDFDRRSDRGIFHIDLADGSVFRAGRDRPQHPESIRSIGQPHLRNAFGSPR
jgi:hypothetical protein